MARESLDERLIAWIKEQHLFFVATAPSEGGHVNLSPKGHDSLRVLDTRRVAYLDLTGSGAETVAHTRENGRVTLMFCAFKGPPRVLRLFGKGTPHPRGSAEFEAMRPLFPDFPGARAIIEIQLDRVATSCGYSIPLMSYRAERPTLIEWSERKGPDGLATYWEEKNATSIDGLPALDR